MANIFSYTPERPIPFPNGLNRVDTESFIGLVVPLITKAAQELLAHKKTLISRINKTPTTGFYHVKSIKSLVDFLSIYIFMALDVQAVTSSAIEKSTKNINHCDVLGITFINPSNDLSKIMRLVIQRTAEGKVTLLQGEIPSVTQIIESITEIMYPEGDKDE